MLRGIGMVIYNKKKTVGNVTNIVLSCHEALNIILVHNIQEKGSVSDEI